MLIPRTTLTSGFSFRIDNSPFDQHQADVLNQLLATLTPDQMIWLSGYLAGVRGAAVVEASTQRALAAPVKEESPAQAVASRDVTILFGSQTGNARRGADRQPAPRRTACLATSHTARYRVVDIIHNE